MGGDVVRQTGKPTKILKMEQIIRHGNLTLNQGVRVGRGIPDTGVHPEQERTEVSLLCSAELVTVCILAQRHWACLTSVVCK